MSGRRLLDQINSVALLVLGAVTFVAIGPVIDKHFPVVRPFVVEQTSVDGGRVLIEGWLEKRRECRFIEVVGLTHRPGRMDVVIPITYLEEPRPKSRPIGKQSWGPWALVVPSGTTSVDLISYHRCHPLWETKTLLATVEVQP